MGRTINILYVHGMGGGGDSRIPSILKQHINNAIPSQSGVFVNVTVRTYNFDPQEGASQIALWMEELKPSLVVGESLGALQAIRIQGVPHILVSPSLNAPLYLGNLAFLALIPGVTFLLDKIYKPREGDRQRLHFSFRILRKYREHRKIALRNSPAMGGGDSFHAFFGTHDHYRKSGIVCLKTWKKYFGDSYDIYEGTHFMEEEYIHSLLIPKILDTLGIK
ncbi:MAG: hypothetical protein ACI4TU_04190 [Candidatus Cryptobacteroides sp.]